MSTPPIMLSLNDNEMIYALLDENGHTIGTGTREVCELLLHILNKQSARSALDELLARVVRETATPNRNIKSAITI